MSERSQNRCFGLKTPDPCSWPVYLGVSVPMYKVDRSVNHPSVTVLCVLVLMILGCNNGTDHLSDLVAKFPLVRGDVNELRQLIHSLARTEGITGFQVGILYNDTPAKVIFNQGKPVTYTEAISRNGFKNKEELERLRAVAQRLPCRLVEIDEVGRLRIVMYYGWNSQWGYVFGKVPDQQANKDERYLSIPGETEWHGFRR